MKLKKTKAIELVDEKIGDFQRILTDATYSNKYDSYYDETYYGTETLIENLFDEKAQEKFRMNVSSMVHFIGGEINQEKEVRDYKDHVKSCISQLNVYRKTIIDFWPNDELEISENNKNKTIISNEIFIIHGHNEGMKQSVARLIEKLGLNPIILHEKPNKGKTIIEKFESNSAVNFAIALLSADDIVLNGNVKKFRPRQNVIFEMGYFIGKLGRERVIALYEENKDIEILSDYNGVLFIPYNNKGSWKYELCKELREANYEIDFNKI